MTELVTAHTVRTEVLEPAMDAVAENLRQQRLLHRPCTPEPDSVLEVLQVAHDAIHRLDDLIRDIARSNGLELANERQVTGWADRVSVDLHHAERADDGGPPSGREIAAHLTELLDEIDTGELLASSLAMTDVFVFFSRTPRDTIFRRCVTYGLGVKRTKRLAELYAIWLRRTGRTQEVPVLA